MSRYPHFLKATRISRYPQRFLCVDCDSELTTVYGQPNREVETLTNWHCVGLEHESNRYVMSRSAMGKGGFGFWDCLKDLCERPSSTWILSFRCNRVWSLLGFWEKIEDEEIEIANNDPWEAQASSRVLRALSRTNDSSSRILSAAYMRRMQQKRCGYLILEDAPTVARFRIKGTKSWLTWLDIRNFGAKIPSDMQAPGVSVRFIAEWVNQYVRFVRNYNLGSLQTTAASQAMHGFKHGYLKTSIYAHCNDRAMAVERSGYYGGRCEAFRLGVSSRLLRQLDVTAMYPSICACESVPVRLSGYKEEPFTGSVALAHLNSGCIATVDIETDQPNYPYRRNFDVIYPIGKFRTTLCGPELMCALSLGHIKRWYCIAQYEMEGALNAFAKAMVGAREAANSGAYQWILPTIKRISVALVGKLGQRDRRWVNTPLDNSGIRFGTWWGSAPTGNACRYRSISGIVQRCDETGFALDAIPAIAGWITSLGRMKLLRYINQAGPHNVWYVDTDSLIVEEAGYDNLHSEISETSKRCGRLRDQSGKVAVEIRGVKYYTAGSRVVCAGSANGYHEDVGDGSGFWYSPGPADSARRGQRPSAERIFLRYHRSREYKHGIVNADGRVTPIRLPE